MTAHDDASSTEFPQAIGRVATRQLSAHGYTRYEDLVRVTRKDLLAIHGVGPRAVGILELELASRGMSYAS
ncbi:hypothetical protein [Georgenia faecalis]|uniref:hypothetical protein n=1 Tax=Georgenia faecalis TaxID=2483799 RepID=UPI000FD89D30|nr:hypothetical protein [Georgenia faecalis]